MKLKEALVNLKASNETTTELNDIRNNNQADAQLSVTKVINNKINQIIGITLFSSMLTLVFTVLNYGTFTDFKYKIILMIGAFTAFSVTVFYKSQLKIQTDSEKLLVQFKRIDITHFFITSSLVVFILISFILRTAVVEGTSMESTLMGSDKIIAYHLNYVAKRNDVVIVDMKEHEFEQLYYVKRLVGLPGDRIDFDRLEGKLYINDILIQDVPLEYRESLYNVLNKMTSDIIPANQYFILGDNVITSKDSRIIGFVKNEQLIGKVIFRFYPMIGVIS
ncbi:MAG TPA: signal peptidase I [Acholeplasma sp.]|nr:signal peptidase I [Acholeplasma sp.]